MEAAKLRSGPGAGYPSSGVKRLGEQLVVYAESPDGDWLRVDPEAELWVAAVQVRVIDPAGAVSEAATQVGAEAGPAQDPAAPDAAADTGTAPESGPPAMRVLNPASPKDILVRLSWIMQIVKTLVSDFKLPMVQGSPETVVVVTTFGFTVLFGLAWLGAICLPLLALKPRWFWGSLVSSFFFGPLGFGVSIYIALLVLTGSDRLRSSSPRELHEQMLENKLMIGLLIFGFIILTAVSIMGGILVYGLLYLYYRMVLLLMPGGRQRYTPVLDYTYTGGYSRDDDDSSDDSDYDSYDDRYDDDGDDDDDDGDKGSFWDGWAMKY